MALGEEGADQRCEHPGQLGDLFAASLPWAAGRALGCPDRRSSRPPASQGAISRAVMLIGVILALFQSVQAEQGTKQHQINVAPSTESPNWRSIFSPTWPSTEIKSSSMADMSMRQTLENANLLQIIKTTLTGARTMDQTNFSPTLYQGSGNSASQEPSEVSAESPVRSPSQDVDETTVVSGLPQIGMFATLSTKPSMTHSSTAVPSQLKSLKTPSISKESTSGSDILATVPSPSFSSLVIQSPHTIIFSKLTVLSTKVPLSTDTESSFHVDSTDSHFSASRDNPPSTVTAVNSSTVNHTLFRRGPKEVTGTTSLNSFGSTMIHSTKTMGRVSPSESISLLSAHSPTSLSVISSQSSLPIASETVSWHPTERTSLSHSTDNVSSSGAIPTNLPFKAVVTDRENDVSPAASSQAFNSKSEIPMVSTSFFHTVGTISALPKVTSHQSSTSTNDMSGSTKAIFLSPASNSSMGVSHSTENRSSFTMPRTFISDAISTSNAVIPPPAPTSMSDFLFRKTTLPYLTDKESSLITVTNHTFNIIAHTNNATNSTPAYENTSTFPLINISSLRSAVSISQAFGKEVTETVEANTVVLRSDFEHTLQPSDGSSVREASHQSFETGSTAKVYTNIDANNVLSHGSQRSRVSPETQASKHTTGKMLPESILKTEIIGSVVTSAVSLPTPNTGLSKSVFTIKDTPAIHNSTTSQLSAINGKSPAVDLPENEETNTGVFTIVTPHIEYAPLPALNKPDFTTDQVSTTDDTKPWTSIVPSKLYALPSFVPATEAPHSPASAFSSISNAASESSLDTTKMPIITASASEWTTTAMLTSAGVSVLSVKETTNIPIIEVSPSTSSLETGYHAPYSTISALKQQINVTNKQTASISVTLETSTSATSNENVSTSPLTEIKSPNFTQFNIHSSTLEMSSVQYSPHATTTGLPVAQSKKDTDTIQNVTEFFTIRDTNFTANFEISPHLYLPSVKDFATDDSTLKSQTTHGKNVYSSTKALYTTPSELPLASQFTDNFIVSANNEISSINGTQPTISSSPIAKQSTSSTTISILTTEKYMASGNLTDFTNSSISEPPRHLTSVIQKQATFSTERWHANGTGDILITVAVPNEATNGTSSQTHTTNALQSVIITSVHASPTQITSAFLPTTNFTHSVITVLPSVSAGAVPTVATSEAKSVTGKSAPTSSFFSRGTENAPLLSVTALSTLISTLAKNNSASKMTPTVAAHTNFPFAPRHTPTLSPHTTVMFLTNKVSTVTASTLTSITHTQRQIETTVPDTKKFTSSEITKTSTAYPLTITAALTSITASAKTTRLPPAPVENNSAAPTTAIATFANVTTVPPPECQLSSNLMVKSVLFLNTRRLLISNSLKENVTKGLTQALRQAFNQNVNAQVEILEQSNNVTVGYYVTKGRLVFIPAVVIEMLIAYGISNTTADIKQHVPNLQSVAVLALPWNPLPAYHFQLKTVLQFVGQTDNIQSCKFVQTMEQRLQKAFEDAERKVLNTSNNLTVQILNTSNVSQAVTLFYVVSNQSTALNGTISSYLLNQLSAELVGFYLTYPPLTIAESLEYPNLDVSETTRDYWVITVIQGVDITLLGLNNQSFARLMEQRLAPLFVMSHQQGRRFKRATTVGSYTVQMVKMQRIPGPKEPAALTYYTLYNGKPLLGTAAAKMLSTVDSQRMALTLGYVIQVQADPVVKNPPNNLWIIAAVLAPIAVVTVIIIIITAVLCRKNKNDFKPDTMMNLPQRAKPVQGFDYAKQHLGQQGAEDEVLPVTQETVVLPLPGRDAPASQEREIAQDGSTIKTAKSNETRKSRSPSQNGSVISNESGKPSSGRSSPQKVMVQQKMTKDEGRKRNVPLSDEEEGGILFENIAKSAIDPFDTSSGSVQLIAIKPVALPPAHPASDRSQESAIINGEVNKALKQKSDIEHYRNKLRLKAKRKGYYDFPQIDSNKGLTERKKIYEKAQKEIDHVLEPEADVSSPFAEPKNRQQTKNSVYRSRQSLNSPSPGETEMDLLVTRERPRRGIRNSGYDTEPEMIEETNVDRVNEPRSYTRSRQAKGHSETSTLSSQPSIDEVRQQMHMLLEEAFSLASAGHGGQNRQDAHSSAQHLPYSEVVTSAPGTMTRPRGGVQWVPTYRPEMYQYSLPRPAYRFSQLPEMVMGSPPPPVPPRTGPVAVASLRRSTSDVGSKTRISESSGTEQAQQHDPASFAPGSRAPVSVGPLDQSALNYSGNTVPAVFAIPAANRPGFTGYFIPTPPTGYRNQAWMPYAGENELPGQWADSVPLPGYIEAYPRSRYQHNSPSRLPRQYSQPANMHPSLEQAPLPSTAASQQSLSENDPSDTPLTNISTAALVKAIREEVAKLAKKQTDMFEFQV
ncbi:KIAA1549 like [Chelydra serpentina]|uniref:KIAA1549 like n=1 Tax=Chelydra serpentina TaxID=8475 RepID=A0A8T1T2U9_CHESE|nr:KIAA1549 like [Chelydra serpentina]